MEKRLALTKEGNLTYCTASDENLGKGRCNHISHQGVNQTKEDFLNSLSDTCKILNYNYISKETKVQTTFLDENNILNIGSFNGLNNALGVQLKGPIIVNSLNYGLKIKFLKTDELNPKKNLHYIKESYDVLYPSISEDIVSKLISNIDINDSKELNSVLYDFHFINGDKTGSLSDNFVEDGYFEQVITEPRHSGYIVNHDDFVNKIIDNRNFDEILNNLNHFYQKSSESNIDFKSFILKQAALDLITGNKDRKGNSTNFVFIENFNGDVKPINIDYGRCLQIMWYEKTENAKLNDDDLDDFVNDFTEDSIVGGGIFSPSYSGDIKKSVDFILNNGFKPFNININKMNIDLKELENKTKNTKLEYYVKCKIKLLNNMLNNNEIKRLWRDVSND